MHKEPLVSVIVPVYNRAELILETLESLHAQVHRPIEIIVVDDGSTDNTAQVVESWSLQRTTEPSFTLLCLRQENQGASAARTRGVQQAKGKYIQFLDSDDILGTTKISAHVRLLEERPEIDFAYGPVCSLEDVQRVIYAQSEMSPSRAILKQIFVSTFHVMGPLSRRNMIKCIGPWDRKMRNFEDWEYFSRASVMGFVPGYSPGGIAYYRIKGPSRERLSATPDPGQMEDYFFALFRRLDNMWQHAIPDVKNNPRFRAALALQHIIDTAKAVKLGWAGKDEERYKLARAIASRTYAVIIAKTVIQIRNIAGRRVSARIFLTCKWLFYRYKALRKRLS